jgi:hypothetical protein
MMIVGTCVGKRKCEVQIQETRTEGAMVWTLESID